MNRTISVGLLGLIILILISCNKDISEVAKKDTLFTALSNSGIDFTNTITNKNEFNIFTYRNFYNGGGVAISDINNDGLPDVYLSSNMGENKLYINKGDLKFEDITSSSGVAGTHAWSTGVVMVDINNDKLLDIYVCNAGNVKGDNQNNELFINNGDLTFSEKAADYGLADSGFTTHAAFFDYDLDGDLDVYLLNNSFIPVNTLGYENKRHIRGKDWNINPIFIGGGDKLLRNDENKFVDVSEQAGIYGSLIGFGLGVTVGDINNDLLPDIYVSNDFYERDYLYINNGDGTFSENIKNWMEHLSLSSMGADMADINNDGNPEIFVTDMLPEDDERLKMTSDFERYDLYKLKVDRDFHHQYMQNTLQLNNGNESFSEIGFYSGVAETDWSWGALMFDMDNDGYKDIYVSNGIYHDLTNQDFMDFFANDIIQKMTISKEKEDVEKVIDNMPSNPLLNYAFKNNQDLTFTNKAEDWGLNQPSFSNGAAYGDLDNDGDLDLIVNNVNQKAFVFRNDANSILKNNFIKVKLEGSEKNSHAIGSLVKVYTNNQILSQEMVPSRGFQSSIDYNMVFGIGSSKQIDSITVSWPNKKVTTLLQPDINQSITINFGSEQEKIEPSVEYQTIFQLKEQNFISHKENTYVDFDYEGLIPMMLSKEGPTISIGDINNDQLEDIFIGGAKDQNSTFYIQRSNGQFESSKIKMQEVDFEDTASTLFDADGDGDLDLYVGSGGNEERNNSALLVDRLYINDNGNFKRKSGAIPSFYYNTSIVSAADFDSDGDLDLFVGSRSVPGTYGIDPENFLLENDGSGNFKDVTESKAFDIKKIGMITDAEWKDITGDGKIDLIVVGEWMAPIIFENSGRRLRKLKTNLEGQTGLWNALKVTDLDLDGDLDLVLGNKGANSFYRTSVANTAKIYINDFDNNGTIEQILTRNINGKDMPIPLRRELSGQLSSLKKEILKFEDYADKSINDLFDEETINNSIVKNAITFKSLVAINNGDNTFICKELPARVQLSSVNSILADDINNDGFIDLIVAGNNFNYKPQFTRDDASYGEILLGSSNNDFTWLPYEKSGFFMTGQVRSMKWIRTKNNNKYIIVGRNNDRPKLFGLNE